MSRPASPLPLAARMGDIEPFHVVELLTRARALEAAGFDVVHMEVGEPDFGTPAAVVEAASRYIAAGAVPYTPSLGLPELREKISAFYRERLKADVPAERIVVTSGASGALLLALGVLAGPGDEVLLADPGYPCNRHFVRLLEATPVAMPVGAEANYQPTPVHLQRHWSPRTRAVLVATPSNPTGTLIDADTLCAMRDLAAARGAALLVDEIYAGLTYDREAQTILARCQDAFVINSFSKYFGMTGWRLGWLVVPEGYLREVEKLAQNLFIAPSGPAQYGALAAFGADTIAEMERRRAEFARRRDYLVPALRELGFGIPAVPQGAFYIYADVSRLTDDSFRFCGDLLEKAHVAITPGVDFGSVGPERAVRIAYTTGMERLVDGVERLRRFLGDGVRQG
jgi:aspartate/methionine/tyrosine aminotransferase